MGIVRLGAGLDCLPEAYTLCDARTDPHQPLASGQILANVSGKQGSILHLFSL